MQQKVQIKIFVTSPKLKKKNQKSPFKHFRFGRSKSPVKGIRAGLFEQEKKSYLKLPGI
jgi:hypothetical protein